MPALAHYGAIHCPIVSAPFQEIGTEFAIVALAHGVLLTCSQGRSPAEVVGVGPLFAWPRMRSATQWPGVAVASGRESARGVGGRSWCYAPATDTIESMRKDFQHASSSSQIGQVSGVFCTAQSGRYPRMERSVPSFLRKVTTCIPVLRVSRIE